MAKVRTKKRQVPQAMLPSQMSPQSMIGANIMGAQPVPSANVLGAQPVPSANLIRPEGMSQQIETMEMKNQGAPAAEPAPMPKPKAKAKVKTKKKAAEPMEPLSPQTWANIGNNPADYPAYLAAFKKQAGKK